MDINMQYNNNEANDDLGDSPPIPTVQPSTEETVETELSHKETREIVTPYAFYVSKDLFGVPLATPYKRACAIIIDTILLVILTQLGGFLLAGVAAATFYRAGNRLQKKMRFNSVIIGLRFLTTLLLFIFVWGILADTNSNNQSSHTVSFTTKVLEELGLSFGWAAFYFSIFTAWWKGQTPGKKIVGIKVIKLDNTELNLWESFGRYGGYGAGFATGLLGFLQIFWQSNRQAIQDKISETLVLDLRKEKVQFPIQK